jgi:hypothetical protein
MHFEMPKPGDEHRKLHAMAGTWASEETLHPSPWDPNGGPAVGRATSRVVNDGFHVATEYEQERHGRVGYRGLGIFGYDTASKRPFMQWCDSMGGLPASTVWGSWQGSTLTFEMKGATEGPAANCGWSRYVYEFDGSSAYTFSILNSKDGQAWSPFMTGRFTRR